MNNCIEHITTDIHDLVFVDAVDIGSETYVYQCANTVTYSPSNGEIYFTLGDVEYIITIRKR